MGTQHHFVLTTCSASLMLAGAILATEANAAYTVTVSQVGANVVASGSGSLNVTDLTISLSAIGIASGYVWPSYNIPGSLLMTAPVAAATLDLYSGGSGPVTFGAGLQVFANDGSGSAVGLVAGSGGGARFYLQQGYVSNSPLTSSSTWNNTTIAALGMTPGTYTWTWGLGPNADSFTLIIEGTQTPAVPTLTLGGLLAIASLLGGVGLLRLRRKAA